MATLEKTDNVAGNFLYTLQCCHPMSQSKRDTVGLAELPSVFGSKNKVKSILLNGNEMFSTVHGLIISFSFTCTLKKTMTSLV